MLEAQNRCLDNIFVDADGISVPTSRHHTTSTTLTNPKSEPCSLAHSCPSHSVVSELTVLDQTSEVGVKGDAPVETRAERNDARAAPGVSASTSYPMRPTLTSPGTLQYYNQRTLAASNPRQALSSPLSHDHQPLAHTTCSQRTIPLAPPSRYLIAHLAIGLTSSLLLDTTSTPHATHTTVTTMAGWGMSWFGGGQTKKEAPKKAILQLRGQLEMLNKREKHLQNQMEEQDTIARKYVSSNKNGKTGLHDPCRLPY